MPVKRVSRPNYLFRGYQGTIEASKIKTGEKIKILPSNEEAKIKSILVTNTAKETAHTGQPVTIQLDKELDISRDCVLNLKITDMFTAQILWLDDINLIQG